MSSSSAGQSKGPSLLRLRPRPHNLFALASPSAIEDGAYFEGGIDIRKGGQPTQQKPNGKDESVPAPEPVAVSARA